MMPPGAQVDHQAKTIRARVALPRPGPCPHRFRGQLGGVMVDGHCTGESGHLAPNHIDQHGRSWGKGA